jgi:hypothetical protein
MQVAAEEAHGAEAAGCEWLVEDLLTLVWEGSAEAPNPKLRLHKLYRGSSAEVARALAPQRSRLLQLFRSSET